MSHHHYILCVLPDGVARPVRIGDDYSVDLGELLQAHRRNDYNLFYISPSWIQSLPDEGVWTVPEELETNVPEFRLQFLPSSTPQFAFRLYININQPSLVKLAQWNILFERECDTSLNSIVSIFENCFCISVQKFEFEFQPQVDITLDAPLMDQRTLLKSTKVIMNITVSQQDVVKAHQRVEILKEIISTEKSYVNCLKLVKEKVTEQLFSEFHFEPDIHKRIFSSIAEIIPSHERFLIDLENSGTAPETSIGRTFRKWIPLFKLSAPHISHYKTANEELRALIEANRNFAIRISQISAEFFDDMPLDNLFIKPIQRIPQYPIFLGRIKKSTPQNHWDCHDVDRAIDGINKLLDELDFHRKKQDELDIIAELQSKFGEEYTIIKTGRKLIYQIKEILVNNDFKAAVFLFNDLVLFVSGKKFISYEIIKTNILFNGESYCFNNSTSIPNSEESRKLYENFYLSRREQIMNMRTFGQAIVWTPCDDVSPPKLSASTLVSIGRKLYLFGGKKEEEGTFSNELWIFSAGIWSLHRTQNTPAPRYMHSMCAYGTNKIVVFGGKNSSKSFGDLLLYDIMTSTWSQIEAANSPSPRSGHTMSFVGSQFLYLFGGVDNSSSKFFNDLNVFDFKINEWHLLVPGDGKQPSPRAWSVSFLTSDMNFAVFGGSANGKKALNDIWVFLSEKAIWHKLETDGTPPTISIGPSAIVYDNSLYLIGNREKKKSLSKSKFTTKSKAKSKAESVFLDVKPKKTTTRVYVMKLNTPKVYTWVKLPQCDAPPSFSFGSCAMIYRFGLVLYSDRLYKIKLCFARESVKISRRASMLQSKRYCTTMSEPIYNAKENTVTTTVDNIVAKNELSLDFNSNSLKEVLKVENDQNYWRLTSVFELDGKSAMNDSCNQFVLNEDQFFSGNDSSRIVEECDERNVPLFEEDLRPLDERHYGMKKGRRCSQSYKIKSEKMGPTDKLFAWIKGKSRKKRVGSSKQILNLNFTESDVFIFKSDNEKTHIGRKQPRNIPLPGRARRSSNDSRVHNKNINNNNNNIENVTFSENQNQQTLINLNFEGSEQQILHKLHKQNKQHNQNDQQKEKKPMLDEKLNNGEFVSPLFRCRRSSSIDDLIEINSQQSSFTLKEVISVPNMAPLKMNKEGSGIWHFDDDEVIGTEEKSTPNNNLNVVNNSDNKVDPLANLPIPDLNMSNEPKKPFNTNDDLLAMFPQPDLNLSNVKGRFLNTSGGDPLANLPVPGLSLDPPPLSAKKNEKYEKNDDDLLDFDSLQYSPPFSLPGIRKHVDGS